MTTLRSPGRKSLIGTGPIVVKTCENSHQNVSKCQQAAWSRFLQMPSHDFQSHADACCSEYQWVLWQEPLVAIEEMTGAKVQAKTHWSRCTYKSLNMFEHSVKCCTSFRSRASTLLLELACQKAGQTLSWTWPHGLRPTGSLDALAAWSLFPLQINKTSMWARLDRREEALCRDYWCACLCCIQSHLCSFYT